MISDEEHDELIFNLRELQARITMRAAPSTPLWTAIKVLESNRVEMKELERKLREANHSPPDSLY